MSRNYISETSDYLKISGSSTDETPVTFQPGEGFTALALFNGDKLVNIDVFGTGRLFRFYAPGLVSSAGISLRYLEKRKTAGVLDAGGALRITEGLLARTVVSPWEPAHGMAEGEERLWNNKHLNGFCFDKDDRLVHEYLYSGNEREDELV